MLLLQYSRSTLFFSSGGCIFVITFTFLGSWRTLLLDILCSAVYVSYFRTLEHTFVLFQVTFICKQTKILHLLFSTTGKTEMRNIVKSSGFSGTIRERSWSRNVFFKNSKVLTEFKCYFWLKFGLMVFANIHTVGNTLSPAICVVISSIGVTVR